MRHLALSVLILALGCLCSCGETGGGIADIAIDGGTNDHVCTDAGDALPNDLDGEGLGDLLEVQGWEIQVDTLGLGTEQGQLAIFEVSSDPNCVDTDGDGLDDLVEYLIRTDPGERCARADLQPLETPPRRAQSTPATLVRCVLAPTVGLVPLATRFLRRAAIAACRPLLPAPDALASV